MPVIAGWTYRDKYLISIRPARKPPSRLNAAAPDDVIGRCVSLGGLAGAEPCLTP